MDAFRKWRSQVRIVESTQILRLRRIGCSNLPSLHSQVSLTKSAARNEDRIYAVLISEAIVANVASYIQGQPQS